MVQHENSPATRMKGIGPRFLQRSNLCTYNMVPIAKCCCGRKSIYVYNMLKNTTWVPWYPGSIFFLLFGLRKQFYISVCLNLLTVMFFKQLTYYVSLWLVNLQLVWLINLKKKMEEPEVIKIPEYTFRFLQNNDLRSTEFPQLPKVVKAANLKPLWKQSCFNPSAHMWTYTLKLMPTNIVTSGIIITD